MLVYVSQYAETILKEIEKHFQWDFHKLKETKQLSQTGPVVAKSVKLSKVLSAYCGKLF